jgi:glutamyl-tRNA synthetase
LIARKTKGKFIIRVEDTDEARSTRESENMILEDIQWMNMQWDEGPQVDGPHGPYRQSERKAIYKKIADDLIAQGKAYPCFCSEEELEAKRAAAEEAGIDSKYDGTWRDADPEEVKMRIERGDPYTVRFKVPDGKICSIDDIVRGTVTWDAEASLGDFIILRSSGMPVYNFCVAVDDADMKITHVIRAEEHLTNTLRQLLILEAMGESPPTYAHCSLILGSDRSKLSKRHGATSVKQFSEQGFLPVAMMNYLANLGWNDGTDKEIYTEQELIEAFDMNRIIKSPAVFDLVKLTWINSQHLRSLAEEEVKPLVEAVLRAGTAEHPAILPPSAASPEKEAVFMNLAAKIAQRDMDLTTDAPRLVGNCMQYDFQKSIETDGQVVNVLKETDNFKNIVAAMLRDYDAGTFPLPYVAGDEDTLNAEYAKEWKAYMKSLGKELGLKGKAIFHPVRLSLTGTMSGPDIGDQLTLLSAAKGVVNDGYKITSVAERIEFLRSVNVEDALSTAEKTAATVAAAEAAAAKAAEEEAALAAATAKASESENVDHPESVNA